MRQQPYYILRNGRITFLCLCYSKTRRNVRTIYRPPVSVLYKRDARTNFSGHRRFRIVNASYMYINKTYNPCQKCRGKCEIYLNDGQVSLIPHPFQCLV